MCYSFILLQDNNIIKLDSEKSFYNLSKIKELINAQEVEVLSLQDPFRVLPDIAGAHLIAFIDDAGKVKKKSVNKYVSLVYDPVNDYVAGDAFLAWEEDPDTYNRNMALSIPEKICIDIINALQNVKFDG